MPKTFTRRTSLFPPQTTEVQFDEKWAFVGKKEQHCDPDEPADRHCGDNWDHVAYDPEHKLVVAVVPGKRTKANTRRLVKEFHRRTGGQPMRLMTSDEYKPYREAIVEAYGEPFARPRQGRRGRHPKPGRRPPENLLYAAVHKHRKKGRVVRVSTHVIYGTEQALEEALKHSACSQHLNIAFVERYNGTDRHQNARKTRKTYCFSKDWDVHNAVTYFTTCTYNFCWPVRTLREHHADGSLGPPRTPAMAAGLTNHLWTIEEWLTHPLARRASA